MKLVHRIAWIPLQNLPKTSWKYYVGQGSDEVVRTLPVEALDIGDNLPKLRLRSFICWVSQFPALRRLLKGIDHP
jgi:hypothetical protein